MSTALAIGAVSAVLRNVLDNGLVDAMPGIGSPVTVSAKAPDLIKLDDPLGGPQLNLFLYRVSLNPGWRNADLPSRDAGGRRIANPPLALDLHYLLTAYGREDLQAEMLLGYGMHVLHERPFLDRAAIRKALELSPLASSVLPDAFQEPPNAGLADQLETLRVTWDPLDLEQLSKLWSAVQSHYRPSAGLQVGVVLIESSRPAVSPLPVLTRGTYDPQLRRDQGVLVEPSLAVPLPTLDAVSAVDGTATAELGEVVTLRGRHLAGTSVSVSLGHRLLGAPRSVPIGVNTDPAAVSFTLPAAESPSEAWPAGVWTVSVTLVPAGESLPRTTNLAAMLLAPTPAPAAPTRDPSTQAVSLQIGLTPRPRPEQAVTVALNGAQATVGPRTTPVDQVTAQFPPLPAGPAWLRVRVDGVESRLIASGGAVPVFRPDRRVTVP